MFGWGDAVKKGLDILDDVYESDSELRESKINAKVKMLEAYHPFRRTQRWLAFMFCAPFAMLLVLGIIAIVFNPSWFDLKGVEDALKFYKDLEAQDIVMLIVLFYFGGGAIESWNRGKK